MSDCVNSDSVSANILSLAEKICSLSLLEIVQLNDCLKDKLKISDSDLATSSTVSDSSVRADVAPVVNTKTEFTITISKYADDVKTKLIRMAKEVVETESGASVGLMEIKRKVDAISSSPLVLCEKVNKEKVDKYSAMLKEIGVEFSVD